MAPLDSALSLVTTAAFSVRTYSQAVCTVSIYSQYCSIPTVSTVQSALTAWRRM